MSLSDRTFRTFLYSPEPGSHGVQRIVIHADLLKASKLSAGDPLLVLKKAGNENEHDVCAAMICGISLKLLSVGFCSRRRLAIA